MQERARIGVLFNEEESIQLSFLAEQYEQTPHQLIVYALEILMNSHFSSVEDKAHV